MKENEENEKITKDTNKIESNDKVKKNKKEKNTKNRKKFKIKHKKTIIVLIIVIAVILFQMFKPKPVVEEKIETEEVQKRTIATSIAATGTVQTSSTKNVVSSLTGTEIKTVNVKEGQRIAVGDVICTFDTSSIQDSLNTAQESLNISNSQSALGIQSAQRSLNEAIANKDTQVNISQSDVDNALKAYQSAENELNNAQNTLNTSKTNLNNYSATYTNAQKNFAVVESNYKTKEAASNKAENEYEAQLANIANIAPEAPEYISEKSKLDQLEQTMNIAKSDYLNYKATYESTLSNFTPIQANYQSLTQAVATAEANVNTLKPNVDTLKQTYDKTVQAYNSTVSTADSTIANMQDSLKNSQLTSDLNSATQKAQVKTYQEQLEKGIVKSDVAGVVTSVSVKPGDIYAGSVIAVIEGAEEFIVESEIDEYDIADIDVGMQVLIKTDATRDEELKGTVIYTAPSATESQAAATMGTTTTTGGNATYKIKVQLNSQNERLRLGMNAKLSIITDSRENVWTVPYDAVYQRDDGSKYIEILKNEDTEEKEEIEVKTGLESSYYVEIISDKLTNGMKVVLPKVQADNSMDTIVQMMGADAGI